MAGKKQSWLIFLLSLCMTMMLCIPVQAANDPVFRLDTNSLNLQKGVSSSIVVSITNAQDSKIVSIDGIENFDVISESQSTSTSIVNNEMTHRIDLYYTIMPKAAGQFTLKANVSYNGNGYETNSLDVNVTEGATDGSGAKPDVFVETVLSHEEAYLGEKIVLTYVLYTRLSVEELGFTDYITIDGVVAKEIQPERTNSETVYIDGYNYVKYTVCQYVIDPIKVGICTIPSYNLQVNVITENSIGGGFGGLGGLFRSTEPRYLQTEAKELTIKSLPTDGKPANFSGIVGALNLEGYYSRNELNYGDSLALQVKATGNCNLDGMKNITGGDVLGFTAYETQKDAVEAVVNDQYHAEKAFEVILIPERTGQLKVPAVSLSYFNPATGKYETAEIDEATINVLGEMPVSNISGGNVQGSFETVLINQVSYGVDTAADDYYTLRMQKGMLYIILGVAVFLIVAGGGLAWFVLSRGKQGDTLKSLYKQAMTAKDINDAYNWFNAMIKHSLSLNLKASAKASISSSLNDTDLAAQITEIMDYMEAPKDGDKELKEKIKNVYMKKLRKL